MEWKTLLSDRRERESSHRQRSADLRSEFEKDYHRIIGIGEIPASPLR